MFNWRGQINAAENSQKEEPAVRCQKILRFWSLEFCPYMIVLSSVESAFKQLTLAILFKCLAMERLPPFDQEMIS